VKHSFIRVRSSRASATRAGNCHNFLTPSRVRREALAARVEKQWHELLLHATIEKDPEKILRLTAELDQRKRRAEVAGKRNGNF
jgi:hypothetical protein